MAHKRYLVVVKDRRAKVAPLTMLIPCSGEIDREAKATAIYNNTRESFISKQYGLTFSEEKDLLLTITTDEPMVNLRVKTMDKNSLDAEDEDS